MTTTHGKIPEPALVVLSGGQDSTTCLFWARQKFSQVETITFNYGQRHERELMAARRVSELSGAVAHRVVALGPVLLGRSPLTDPTQPLEQYSDYDSMQKTIGDRVELTFVPMRNALFLTLAANHAAVKGIRHLITGVCEEDGTNYPDCREPFIASQEQTINEALGRRFGVNTDRLCIHAPLLYMTKEESIRLAMAIPGAMHALSFSHTAYDGSYPPTGADHATVLRARGFEEAGVPDPLILRAYFDGHLSALPTTPNYSPGDVAEYARDWKIV